MPRSRRFRASAVLTSAALALALAGCAATTRQLDVEEPLEYDANYGFSDKKEIVEVLTKSLATSPAVARARSSGERPVAVIYPVANRTSEHIDTSGITDDIRNELLSGGELRFVNRPARDSLIEEADYQYAGFVDPAQRVAEGRQVGADFVLSGTLRSIEKSQPAQWRLFRKNLVYYSMTMELTGLESGEILWADSVELARELSRPIVRW